MANAATLHGRTTLPGHPEPISDEQGPDSSWLADRAREGMRPGSVLLHAPSWAFQSPGGGENQLVRTARHLEAHGVAVRPFSPWTDRLGAARLVHLFGMSREGLELARVARAMGVPVVLSPICWFEPRAVAALAKGRTQAAWDLAKWCVRATVPRVPSWRRELLHVADAILPNSDAEGHQLVRLFGADPGRIRVVPNGVDRRFAACEPSLFREIHGAGDFVLYVGRIEPRKNVLGLVRAVRASGYPLVALGDAVPGHEGYVEVCRREGGGFARWIPRVDHDNPLLASAYAACRVFALPSWFETPGLAALEAGLAGRPVVITPFGCTREYFGDRAHYARPDRPAEIARAISLAWEKGPSPQLSQTIGSRFLWSEVARKTAEVYDEVAA
jgi:glycosyltransferase involved in cell wall biosynthesis